MNLTETNNEVILIKDKINLTVREAAQYSNIGETKIRKLLEEKGCPFMLKIGKKNLIKRNEFEKFLEKAHYL